MRVFTVLCLTVLCAAAFAQTPGTCELGVAEGDLDVDGSEVFARVFNTGALFFGNETTAGNGYIVPATSGNSPLFAMTFALGGQVDGEIRTAAARYTRYEFWPGPLDDGATLPSPTNCSSYDRIFVVSREDVRRYLGTTEATDDLHGCHLHPRRPEGGDQPAIYGDQMAWTGL